MENNLNFNGSVDPPPGSETKLVVVTGAARRVGKTIALHLAQKGYAIGLHYHQSDEEAMATAQEIEKIGGKVMLLKADLSRSEEVENLFQKVEASGLTLTLLINSAATMKRKNLLAMTVDEWDQTFDLNTRAVWLCSREAASRMPDGGLIINISDIGAEKNWTTYGAYSISKAAVESITRVMARQLAPQIRVCCIAPGLLLKAEGQSDLLWQQLVDKVPMGRPTRVEELLVCVDFLRENTYITGETIHLAGGYQLV